MRETRARTQRSAMEEAAKITDKIGISMWRETGVRKMHRTGAGVGEGGLATKIGGVIDWAHRLLRTFCLWVALPREPLACTHARAHTNARTQHVAW